MTTAPPDSVAQFAADLRALRLASGNPTLKALTARSGRAKTMLAEAFRGDKLPSRETLSLIVKALDADDEPWMRRWTRLRLAVVDPSSVGAEGVAPRFSGTAKHIWLTVAVGVVCLAVGVVIGVMAPRPGKAPVPAQHVAVTAGADPWAEPACKDDATRKGFATRSDHYLVEIMWSQTCNALWGQITRFDGAREGNALTATVTLAYEPATAQTVTATDVQTVHTPLLLSPGRTGTVCVTGTAQVGTDEIDLSPPLCADTP